VALGGGVVPGGHWTSLSSVKTCQDTTQVNACTRLYVHICTLRTCLHAHRTRLMPVHLHAGHTRSSCLHACHTCTLTFAHQQSAHPTPAVHILHPRVPTYTTHVSLYTKPP
jgi:hypothetical protein